MTAIQPNVTKDEWLHCPEVSKGGGEKYGYAMNPDAGGKKLRTAAFPRSGLVQPGFTA